jgi:hypothetical protein
MERCIRRYDRPLLAETHTLHIHASDLRRSTRLHDLAHGMVWHDGHAEDFAGVLLNLWQAAFDFAR